MPEKPDHEFWRDLKMRAFDVHNGIALGREHYVRTGVGADAVTRLFR